MDFLNLKVIMLLLLSVEIFAEECVKYDFEEDLEEVFAEVRSCNNFPLWTVGFYNETDVPPPHAGSKTFIAPRSARSCLSSSPFVMNSNGTLEVYVYMDSKTESDIVEVLVKIFNPSGNEIVVGHASLSSANMLETIDGLQKMKITWFDIVTSQEGYLVFMGTASEESTIFIDSYHYIPPGRTDSECKDEVETFSTSYADEGVNLGSTTDIYSQEFTTEIITSTKYYNLEESSPKSILSTNNEDFKSELTISATIQRYEDIEKKPTILNIKNESSEVSTAQSISTASTTEWTSTTMTNENYENNTFGNKLKITKEINKNKAKSTIESKIGISEAVTTRSIIVSPTDENSGEDIRESIVSITIKTDSAENTIESTIPSRTNGNPDYFKTDQTDEYSTESATYTGTKDEDSILKSTEFPIIITPESTSWNNLTITAASVIGLIVLCLIYWCSYNYDRVKVKGVKSIKIVNVCSGLTRPETKYQVTYADDGIMYVV